MDDRHRSAEDAHHGGWPRVSSRPTPPTGTPPPVSRCHAVSAAIPTFSWLPEHYMMRHGAHGPDAVAEPWRYSAPSPSGSRYTLSPSPYGWTTPTQRSSIRRGWLLLPEVPPDPTFVFRSSS